MAIEDAEKTIKNFLGNLERRSAPRKVPICRMIPVKIAAK